MGLALAAIVKGYKLICVSNDKQSKEKFDVLRAVGADVIVCPTDVEPEDPRSYYSTSKRIASETPNSWYANQYDNPSNAQAHYETTGPEIWNQTDGKITHFVVGVGTGGTISLDISSGDCSFSSSFSIFIFIDLAYVAFIYLICYNSYVRKIC